MFNGFYTDEELLDHFGKLEPSTHERTLVFNNLWKEYGRWSEVDLSTLVDRKVTTKDVSDIRKRFGAFNAVNKGTRIRFKDRNDLLVLKLYFT